MLEFNQLSEKAQDMAVENFIERAGTLLGNHTFDKQIVHQLLSKSMIHRYNEQGIVLGKMITQNGVKKFDASGRY